MNEVEEGVFDQTEDSMANHVRDVLEARRNDEPQCSGNLDSDPTKDMDFLFSGTPRGHGIGIGNTPKQEFGEMDKELGRNKLGFVLETREQITRFFKDNARLSAKIIILFIILSLIYPAVILKSNIDCHDMISTAKDMNETAGYMMTSEKRNLFLANFYSQCLYLTAITNIHTGGYNIANYRQLAAAEEEFYTKYGYTNRNGYFNRIMSKLKESYTSGRKYNNVLFTTNYNGRLNDHNNLLFKNEVQLLLPGSNFTGNEQHMGLISALDQVINICIYLSIDLCVNVHTQKNREYISI